MRSDWAVRIQETGSEFSLSKLEEESKGARCILRDGSIKDERLGCRLLSS